MPKPIRVVVIDPHPIFRKGVIATLQRSEELMLVGEGATVDDARRILRDKAPEALMLEVAIAEGLEVAEDVVKSGAKCVVLTALDDVLSVSTALNVGVSGYILKGISGLDLIKALLSTPASAMPPQNWPFDCLKLAVRSHWGRDARATKDKARSVGASSNFSSTSPRGLTNEEIAEKLGLSHGTIKYYISQLFKKMRVRNRLEAIIAARNQAS